eukprot:4427406-Ditylum_brightwellii.AAC.1
MEYPLEAITLTMEECRKIKSPALKVAINGPDELLRLGGNTLYQVQSIKHIRIIIDHNHAPTITGNQVQATIERHKMELGCRSSLFSTFYQIFHWCTTDKWIKHTWKFMPEKKCAVNEQTKNLELIQENDQFIMEAFAAARKSPSQLKRLNRCTQYLKVTTVADITSGDGQRILIHALNGKKLTTKDRY